jgi:hypothetical protein
MDAKRLSSGRRSEARRAQLAPAIIAMSRRKRPNGRMGEGQVNLLRVILSEAKNRFLADGDQPP